MGWFKQVHSTHWLPWQAAPGWLSLLKGNPVSSWCYTDGGGRRTAVGAVQSPAWLQQRWCWRGLVVWEASSALHRATALSPGWWLTVDPLGLHEHSHTHTHHLQLTLCTCAHLPIFLPLKGIPGGRACKPSCKMKMPHHSEGFELFFLSEP